MLTHAAGFYEALAEKIRSKSGSSLICTPLPCSSFSEKGLAWLACSVVNALATAHFRSAAIFLSAVKLPSRESEGSFLDMGFAMLRP